MPDKSDDPGGAVECTERLDGQGELEDTIAPGEPDPAAVEAAEAELEARRIAVAQQAVAARVFGVQPAQVVSIQPVAATSAVDVTVRIDTRSVEWQRTVAQRVLLVKN